jgi:hypothetical protein
MSQYSSKSLIDRYWGSCRLAAGKDAGGAGAGAVEAAFFSDQLYIHGGRSAQEDLEALANDAARCWGRFAAVCSTASPIHPLYGGEVWASSRRLCTCMSSPKAVQLSGVSIDQTHVMPMLM